MTAQVCPGFPLLSALVFLRVIQVRPNIIIHRKHMIYPHQGTAALGSNLSYPQVNHDLSTELSTGGPKTPA